MADDAELDVGPFSLRQSHTTVCVFVCLHVNSSTASGGRMSGLLYRVSEILFVASSRLMSSPIVSPESTDLSVLSAATIAKRQRSCSSSVVSASSLGSMESAVVAWLFVLV